MSAVPSYGLSDFGITLEYAFDIHTERELDVLIEKVNAPLSEDTVSNVSPHLTSPSTIAPDIPTNIYDVKKCYFFKNLPKILMCDISNKQFYTVLMGTLH